MQSLTHMATLGQALAHQQALWVGLALGFAWLIANAELVPGAMAPALLAVRRPIAGACNALLSGWWPVVAGECDECSRSGGAWLSP